MPDVIVATASPLFIRSPILFYSRADSFVADLNENSETNSNTGIAQTKYHSGKYSRNFPPRCAFVHEHARPRGPGPKRSLARTGMQSSQIRRGTSLMRQKHNTLLAGVAALALLAGGGIAAAQQNPQGPNNAGANVSGQGTAQKPSGKPAGAAPGMEQHAQTSSPGGTAASPEAKTSQPSMAKEGTDNAKSLNKPENRTAKTGMKNGGLNAKQSAAGTREHVGANAKILNNKSSSEAKQRVGENAGQNARKTAKSESKTDTRERIGAREKSRHERMGANTRSERQPTRVSQRSGRKNELKGLQGNASLPMQGSHVNLTSEQRTTVRDSVIDARGAPRVGHVNFDVTVGTLVPRDRVHVVRVPETLVRIDPQWHGYLYFIVEDEVVIVNPRDMRIVAVLDV
jgi:hypothetical protein